MTYHSATCLKLPHLVNRLILFTFILVAASNTIHAANPDNSLFSLWNKQLRLESGISRWDYQDIESSYNRTRLTADEKREIIRLLKIHAEIGAILTDINAISHQSMLSKLNTLINCRKDLIAICNKKSTPENIRKMIYSWIKEGHLLEAAEYYIKGKRNYPLYLTDF